jgi:thiamine pyrophosphate-dependent acetolactate synthase large subunit-like protein
MTAGTLDRRVAVRTLLQDRGETLVITGLGSSTYDTFAAGDHDANFYLWGAMGGAALMGLGLALAQPKKPVLVITGDGEQLMGLGGLVTIGVQKPKNLTIAVLDNGHFGETGMQMSHSGLGADLVAIAQSCGMTAVHDVRDEAGLLNLRKAVQDMAGGPRFAAIRIANGEHERALAPRDGVYVRNRMRQHLGLKIM